MKEVAGRVFETAALELSGKLFYDYNKLLITLIILY